MRYKYSTKNRTNQNNIKKKKKKKKKKKRNMMKEETRNTQTKSMYISLLDL